jgi:hypothetical protein
MKRPNLGFLCLLLLAAPATVQAQYSYTVNAGGTTATLTGGSLSNAVIIPTNISGLLVTAIASNAFGVSTNLTSITIPGSVSNIGNYAFYGCPFLTNAIMLEGVSNIGAGAFGYCSNLASVSIPASVDSLGVQAFADCTNLASITVDPANLFYTNVNGVLFNISLTTLVEYPAAANGSCTIPGSVTDIGDSAFYDCLGLTGITIPASVTNIGNYAFYGCLGLTNAAMANGVSSIGVAAFCFHTNLAGITIPGSVASIGNYAFFGCLSLTNASIANGVTNIGVGAFCSCSGLTNIFVPGSVASIGVDAFEYCTSLSNATIASGVNSIGEYAFWDYTNLAGVYFGGNVPATLGAGAFYPSNHVTAYYLPAATGWDGFSAGAGIPAVLWNPLIQTGGSGFGVQSNQFFGFNITNAANLTVVVEACTNLASPVWTPLQTTTPTNGSYHFSEPLQPNSPGRYYGLGFP